jgi:hypothetical protein
MTVCPPPAVGAEFARKLPDAMTFEPLGATVLAETVCASSTTVPDAGSSSPAAPL